MAGLPKKVQYPTNIFILVIMSSEIIFFCDAEYPAACCVGFLNKAKPDLEEKIS
jgi:hypothetical protein